MSQSEPTKPIKFNAGNMYTPSTSEEYARECAKVWTWLAETGLRRLAYNKPMEYTEWHLLERAAHSLVHGKHPTEAVANQFWVRVMLHGLKDLHHHLKQTTVADLRRTCASTGVDALNGHSEAATAWLHHTDLGNWVNYFFMDMSLWREPFHYSDRVEHYELVSATAVRAQALLAAAFYSIDTSRAPALIGSAANFRFRGDYNAITSYISDLGQEVELCINNLMS